MFFRGRMGTLNQEPGHVIHHLIRLNVRDAVYPLRFFGGDLFDVFAVRHPGQHLRMIGFGNFHDLFKISPCAGGD